MTTYTISEWLAKGANEWQAGNVYEQPERVALPGALQSIPVEELERHLAQGLTHHQITAFVNQRFRTQNATRLATTRTWVEHTYLPALDRRKQVAVELKADEMRRRALVEKIIAEREVNDARH